MSTPAAVSTPSALADRLGGFVVATVGELRDRHLPGWRIPGTFGGHLVEPDAAADLVFTLSHLHRLGVTEVGGSPLPEAISAVLGRLDGRRTHTFFSYRVAETLAAFGDLEHNPLLEGFTDAQRDEVVAACDSTEWVELLDLGLPRNYAAVLARCELSRRRLGLPVDEAVLSDLLARTRTMLAADDRRTLDDSTHGIGRYDIYSADVWLFTEPLAAELGDLWVDGLGAALALVERIAAPDGSAVPWGRSTGVLGLALTVELAALALAGQRDYPEWTGRPGWWLAAAATATEAMPGWFDGGVVSAHRHRSPYRYRGPFRRLQMTLDVLGKLAWAAVRLREVAEGAVPAPEPLRRQRDELIVFDDARPTGVWSFDSGGARPGVGLGFVVPLVGATPSDYLAAPRRPGLFEVPVDSPIACWVPLVADRHRTWAPAGVPAALDHAPGRLTARWEGLCTTGELDPAADAERLGGRCEITWEVHGRSITQRVELDLDRAPTAVSVLVPEAERRPLRVEVLEGEGARADLVETSGIAEWRSYYGELPAVHQVDLDPSTRHHLAVRVTPTVRVASTAHGHHYDDCLYAPLWAERRAASLACPVGPLADRRVRPEDVDVFHLHWPEWLAFDDLDAHRRIIERLGDVPVVWTAHNLTPHDRRPDAYDGIYRLWADRSDAVVHHSAWGEARMRQRWAFRADARHVVVPHGHFGDLYPNAGTPRDEAADRLGLPPAALRIGLVGAPRADKDVLGFLAAVARCRRDDISVCCWSLDPGESAGVPDDPRIAVAEPYENVDAGTYGLRLAACDVIALPFDPDGDMLCTGVAADVVGCGLAALGTPWPYLVEALGDALIPTGASVAEMASAIDAITPEQVADARAASIALRPSLSWDRLADRFADLLDDLLLGP